MSLRQRTFAFIAAAGLLLHALVLLSIGGTPLGSLLSNLLQFALGMLVIAATLDATSRSGPFATAVWRLVALGFCIYTVGQAMNIWFDSMKRASVGSWWVSDPVLFFWIVPLILAAAIDPTATRRRVNLNLVLDACQLLLLVAAVYLLIFGFPSQWEGRGRQFQWLEFQYRSGRDVLVLLLLVTRAALAEFRLSRRLFARLSVYFAIYASFDICNLYLMATFHAPSGTLMDLGWSLPRVLLIAIALLWNKPDESELRTSQYKRRTTYFVNAAAVMVPLILLFITDELRHEHPFIGYSIATISLLLAGLRLLSSQNQRDTAMREVVQANQLFSTVINGVNEAIYLRDREGRYLLVNDTGANMLQRPREEIIGHTDRELLDPVTAAEIERTDRLVMQTARTYSTEEEFLVRGKLLHLFSTKDVYRNSNGEVVGVVGVAVDLTDRRKLEEQLHRAQKMESIGTLSGGLAHDFNNLLTVILGYGDMLLDRAQDPATLQGLKHIHGAAERAAALTRQLLAFSRKQVLQPRVVQINEIIKNLEPLMTRLIGEDIQIRINLARDLGFIEVDPGQMDQVFMNLAANSRDAMPKGGLLTIATTNVDLTFNDAAELDLAPGRYVEIMVSDTGSGIAPEIQQRIFEPFFTTKEIGKGTGLGLSTVYGIVKQSGGQVSLFSVVGQGTAFHLYFPRVEKSASVETNKVEKSSSKGNETILLVEDNDMVRNLARESLEKNGYCVLSASSPEMARTLESAHEGEISLLLTDLVMPGTSGENLAVQLQRSRPQLRVIYMSGYAPEKVMSRLDGEMSFVSKPFTSPILLRAVRKALDEKTS